MTPRETTVVVLMDPAVHPALARLLASRDWARFAGATADEALDLMPREPRPVVAVVQSGADVVEGAALIARLRGPWWRSRVVALSLRDEQEPFLRAAGPVSYFGPGAPAESVEATVDHCLSLGRAAECPSSAPSPSSRSAAAAGRPR